MASAAVELYEAAFVARSAREPGVALDAPGLCGVVSSDGERAVRLLATDDRSYDRLAAEVATASSGTVQVLASAPSCDELLRGQAEWVSQRPSTAMVCRDVDAVPAVALPEGLMLRPVERLVPLDEAVPLVDAAAVAVAADSDIADTPVAFARFLESLPGSVRLFAAIDEEGVVRATSGCDVVGEHTRVLFVNTDRSWRGRGIGRAMTAAALQAAAGSGARRAYLDATDIAVSLYRRLGFEAAGRSTRYVRSS